MRDLAAKDRITEINTFTTQMVEFGDLQRT